MRKIKVQDVKPGMEIEWKHGGYHTKCVVGLMEKENLSYPAYSIRAAGSSAGWKIFSEGAEVTVLSEPQPEEPTAFGAAVEAGGVWFVRLDVRTFKDPDFQPWQSESLIQCTWADICEQGPVTIINADPFATPVQGKAEPRKWDRWEDVPDMVEVQPRTASGLFRRNGDRIERLLDKNGWWTSALTAITLNAIAPFTEELDA